MDDKEFKQRASRLEEIGKILEKLPSEVRGAAFDLLKGYATGHDGGAPPKKERSVVAQEIGNGAPEDFFALFDHDKPADNVKLIAAYFYRQQGAEAFSLEDVRQKADDVGITIPARADMTLLQAKEKGKKLFTRAGKGMFRPTVHGEAYLKATYSVRKGTKK